MPPKREATPSGTEIRYRPTAIEVMPIMAKNLLTRASLKLEFTGPLAEALFASSLPPWDVSENVHVDFPDDFQVDGVPAGSLRCPDVAKLTSVAAPAAFGRGGETLHDPAVRNALEVAGSHGTTT